MYNVKHCLIMLYNIYLISYSTMFYNVMKVSIAATIDDEMLKWVESQVKKGKFANRSHGIEYCIRYTKNNEK